MASKDQRANDANWMAIQQAYKGTPQGMAAAIGATLQSDIMRDRADKGDVNRTVANTVYAQAGDEDAFYVNMLKEHPDMLESMLKYLNKNNINITNVKQIIPFIPAYLESRNHTYEKYAEGGQFESNQQWIEVQVGEKVYNLLVATTEEEKERGLMNVEQMDENEGMLFDYSDEPQAELSFWMKNTDIPLDIIFVNQDGIVISVKQGQPNSEEYITEDSEFISCVIELNANSGVKPGDKTDLFSDINNEIEELDEEDETDEHPELEVNRLYVYGSDGNVQAELQGGERIFSRKSSAVIIRKAKKAYASKEDKDYKALGRYIFKEMKAQDERPAEYVET